MQVLGYSKEQDERATAEGWSRVFLLVVALAHDIASSRALRLQYIVNRHFVDNLQYCEVPGMLSTAHNTCTADSIKMWSDMYRQSNYSVLDGCNLEGKEATRPRDVLLESNTSTVYNTV